MRPAPREKVAQERKPPPCVPPCQGGIQGGGFPPNDLLLSSAYGIIKAHNGAIGLTSDVGKGPTFYLWLPRPNA